MARMGVVRVVDKSFAGTKVPKKQGKNEKSLKHLHISPEKGVFPTENAWGLSNTPYIFCNWQLQFLLQAFQITQNRVA